MKWTCAALLPLLTVAGVRADEPPSFTRQVTPLLYKLGCSAGQCHGSFSGKGGLRLALFAGNNDQDYANLRGGLGRRVDPLDPAKSLLLLKPTGALGHGGGVRIAKGGWEYQLLKAWIEGGALYDAAKEPKVRAVRVEPAAFTATLDGKGQPLKVFSKLSSGQEEDVTRFTRFESLDPGTADVDASGQVKGVRIGDVAVLAHYGGQVGFATVLVPGPPLKIAFPAEQTADPVDRLLLDRMKQLHIAPSPRCDDLEFLRRAHLDVIGVLPLPEEIRAYLADKAADKREKLIDRLLQHPYHAAMWAGKMCDMVGADDRFLGDGVYNFHDWFRNKLEKNTPWDQLAYGVLCGTAADDRTPEQILADQKREAEERKKEKEAKGAKAAPDNIPPWHKGYATRKTLEVFHSNLIHTKTIEGKGRIVDARAIALRVAHTFLGVRLECAQCHKHPHDRWSQQDFLSFAAAFSYIDFGADPALKAQKVQLGGTHPSMKQAEEMLDPDTQAPLPPRRLGAGAIAIQPGVDARKEIWQWMLEKDNPYFTQAIVNRVWEHYLGRGFIEPADAQAGANPPSHPEALSELAREFVASKYDLRKLHRRILQTLAYQRDWRTNASNAKDARNFSHRQLRRLTAEQALDALAQATGTPVKIAKRYATAREGQRAVEVALSRVGGDDGYLLQIFGRPIRVQNCDCERSPAASLSQTLYLFNDEKLLAKIGDAKGRLTRLTQELKDDAKLVEELYLLTLTRFPTTAEVQRSLEHVKTSRSRPEGFQDILWSLFNRQDFIMNH